MMKKSLSIVLSLLLLVSIIPNVASAEKIDFQPSGDGEVSITGTTGDVFDVVFSIDPVSKVQGLQLEFQPDYTYFTFGGYEFNEDAGFADTYVNSMTGSTSAIYASMLFNVQGKTFTEKTDLLKLKLNVKFRRNPTDVLMKFSVKEFYGESDSQNAVDGMEELDHNLITARVVKESDEVTLSSISVKEPTKTNYFVGESLDTTGMTVTANYSDNTTKDVTSEASLSGFDSTTAGIKTITVTYQGKTATFTVNVKSIDLTGIAIETKPIKLEYYVGEEFDPTGIKVTASYSNGTTADVTDNVTYNVPAFSAPGTMTITVVYQGKTAAFTVNVSAVTMTKIELTTLPNKTKYLLGEEIDLLGMTVTAFYSDGTYADVTDDVIVTGFDSSSSGEKLITVSFGNVSAEFTVTVLEQEKRIMGDIDNDGDVTANDAVIILRYSINVSVDDYSDYEDIMDVDHNGVIDSNDAVLILRYSIHLISSFE